MTPEHTQRQHFTTPFPGIQSLFQRLRRQNDQNLEPDRKSMSGTRRNIFEDSFLFITIDCESAPTSVVCMYAFECRYQDLFQKSFSDIRYLFQVLDIRTFRFGKCVFTLKHGSPHLPICCVIFLF